MKHRAHTVSLCLDVCIGLSTYALLMLHDCNCVQFKYQITCNLLSFSSRIVKIFHGKHCVLYSLF